MKEQYVGDINDYRKYALLRLLSRSGLKLGVCWMLTPSDGRSDGNKLAYLNKPRDHEHQDPELFALLRRVKDEPDSRRLALIEDSDVLSNATFVNTIVPDALFDRQIWFRRASAALADTDLVFFDPDNGLEVSSVAMGRRHSSKYVYLSEVAATCAAGHSVLIYQHFARENRARFVASVAEKLRAVATDAEVWAFRTSHVVFMLLIQRRHRAALSEAAASIVGSADPDFLRAQLIKHASG